MVKQILILVITLFFYANLFAQNKKKISIADNKVSLELPASFEEAVYLEDNNWMIKNKDQMVWLIYRASNEKNIFVIPDNDIPSWTDKQLSIMRKDSLFNYIDDGIFLQDGKNIGYIKSSKKQEKGFDTFHMLFYISVDNKPLQFIFTCPLNKRKKWEPLVDGIANSLRIIK